MEECKYHEEHKKSINRNESDIQDLWKELSVIRGNMTKFFFLALSTVIGIVSSILINVIKGGS